MGWESRVFQTDVEFHQRFIDDWNVLRQGHLSVEQWHARIDRHAAPLLDRPDSDTGPATRNFVVWDTLGERSLNEFISPVTDTYEEQISFLKEWADERFDWIDDQFPEPPRVILAGEELTLRAGTLFRPGATYYTLDGSDPRLLGGEVSPLAIEYANPITFSESSLLTTRWKNGDDWSGKITERLVVGELGPTTSNLGMSDRSLETVDSC